MNNKAIRFSLFENGVRMWELAKLLGVCEMTLYRKFREELQEDEQKRIVSIIEDYAQKKESMK